MKQFSFRDLVRLESTPQNQKEVYQIKSCLANSIDSLLNLHTQTSGGGDQKRIWRQINRLANQSRRIERIFARHEAKLSVQQKKQNQQGQQYQQNQNVGQGQEQYYSQQPQMQGSNS